ncbi:MAG: hypothetical protein JKX72_03000 [Robiginitomaculum sp.]|nr:hypothetical protein [Robiginitomaculum sp.]
MPRPTINKALHLVLGTMLCSFLLGIEAQAQYDVGPGECVQRSGTCGSSSSTGDSSYTRTYVDPYILEERRRVREAKAQEKRRVRAVRKKTEQLIKG